MRLTTAALLTLAAAHIRCYDYEDYDYFPEPGPPQAHDLPPGTLDDAPGDDVVVRTRLGAVLGRRRTDDVHLGRMPNFFGVCFAIRLRTLPPPLPPPTHSLAEIWQNVEAFR